MTDAATELPLSDEDIRSFMRVVAAFGMTVEEAAATFSANARALGELTEGSP